MPCNTELFFFQHSCYLVSKRFKAEREQREVATSSEHDAGAAVAGAPDERTEVTALVPSQGFEGVCTICQESMCTSSQTLEALLCGHTFHSACIVQWATSRGVPKAQACPLCRSSPPVIPDILIEEANPTPTSRDDVVAAREANTVENPTSTLSEEIAAAQAEAASLG